MSTVRANVAELYTSIYDSFMLSTFEQYKGGCIEAFDEITTKQKNFIVDDISGFGEWETVDELSAANFEDPVLGYSKTYTVGDMTKGFQVSFQAVEDDEYALIRKESDAKNMGIGADAKVKKDLSGVLINGFSVAGPDGVYLFSASHPKNREESGTLFSNLLSGAFSHDNLELAETQISANMFDMKGIPIPITQDPLLLYPPALRGQVQRVLSERAVERPGTTNRDVNQFAVRKGMWNYKPVEDVYLGAALGGSNTAWYIVFPWLGYFKMVWRKKPAYYAWIDYSIRAYNFLGEMRYVCGYDNWRAAFGSTGL